MTKLLAIRFGEDLNRHTMGAGLFCCTAGLIANYRMNERCEQWVIQAFIDYCPTRRGVIMKRGGRLEERFMADRKDHIRYRILPPR